jgi:DNA-binding MarR family transcriptional regulator
MEDKLREYKKEIYDKMLQLKWLMHKQKMSELTKFDNADRFNPREGQGRVLSILRLKPEISQKELSYLLDMSKQALAMLLVKLEKSGLIERIQSQEDKRELNIKLTDEGRRVAEGIDQEPQPYGLDMLDCLSEQELQALHQILNKIIDNYASRYQDEDSEQRKKMIEQFVQHCGEMGERFLQRGGFGFVGAGCGSFERRPHSRGPHDHDHTKDTQ